jgi:type II secretory pathway pseudopilin PulG
MDNLRFLITILLKKAKSSESTKGFTLIEILVAMIIAFFVITPLLGLAVSLLNTDRQEQAKATSEQEIQAAADFIARDIQQAVFIYNPEALTKVNSSNPTLSGIKNQIPPGSGSLGSCTGANCVPVLAFWKRRPVNDAVPTDSANDAVNTSTGTTSPKTDCTNNSNRDKCDDTFVYSLVAYYLIRDNSSTDVWSPAARIGRFEITDGVKALNGGTIEPPKSRKKKSDGFQLFNLTQSAPTIADKMNSWEKAAGPFSANDMQILIDYVDQTPVNAADPLPSCPTSPTSGDWSQTPIAANPSLGFSVCVNQTKNIARVFLRGNALARIRTTVPNYEESQSSYFPRAMAEVRAVGKLVQ